MKSAANDNANAPLLALRVSGDGRALYRVLARVLVRRELIFASAISPDDDCAGERRAG